MAQITSGKVLREARERKDYDLNTVARRLRIRPDILRAIEAGDFSSMPPRGYTRNMVNAYARLLGLNPTEIVNMYLDEAYANQVQKARGTVAGSGFVMENDARRPRVASRNARSSRGEGAAERGHAGMASPQPTQSYPDYQSAEDSGRTRRRHLYDDRTQFSRDDYGITRERVERPGRSDRDFLSHHSGYGSTGYSGMPERSRRSGGRDIHVGQTPMEYSAPRLPAVFQQRPVLIAAIVIAVLVVVALVFLLTRGGGEPAADDVSQLPVSGISDTTGTADGYDDEATVEIAPTSARVQYSVASGDSCYIETYTNGGDVTPAMLRGPVDETLEVTGTWTITTFSPGTIKVKVNGEEVTLETNEKYKGMYAYTVDFQEILSEWKSTHTSKTSQRDAAVAEATAAAEKSRAEAEAEEEEDSASASSASASSSSASASSTGTTGNSGTGTTGSSASAATTR